MTTIALEGMNFFAHHGWYEEERITGNDYRVDVYFKVDLLIDTFDDDIEETINYENIYKICQDEMMKTQKLIETVGINLFNTISLKFPRMTWLKVKITKHAPIPFGNVDQSLVEIENTLK